MKTLCIDCQNNKRAKLSVLCTDCKQKRLIDSFKDKQAYVPEYKYI